MSDVKITCDGCGGSQLPSTVTQVPFREATVDVCEHCLDALWRALDRVRLSKLRRHGMDGDPRHAWYEMGVALGRKARMQRGDRHPRTVRI